MTLLDSPKAAPQMDPAQVLFEEARQRRRRRWLISGLVSGVALLVVSGVTVGMAFGRGGARTATSLRSPPPAVGVVAHPSINLSFRPVLCYAPPLSGTPSPTTSTSPLPPCSGASKLNASNLHVVPEFSNIGGYTSNLGNVQPDPQFSTYASTTPSDDKANGTVILPSSPPNVNCAGRCVLGPAALTQADIASARATLDNGQWVLKVVLTPEGSVKWDSLTQAQFHALIGIVLNGQVISAPITQPTQTSWSSFGGRLWISFAGPMTEQQVKAIAARL